MLDDLPIELIYEIARKDIKIYFLMYPLNKKITRALKTEYLRKQDIFIKDNEYYFMNVKHNFGITRNIIDKNAMLPNYINKNLITWYFYGFLTEEYIVFENGYSKTIKYYKNNKKFVRGYDRNGRIRYLEYYTNDVITKSDYNY